MPELSTSLKPEEENLLLEVLEDAELYAAEFLKIKDKRGDTVPLIYNPVQKRVFDEIKKLKASGKPVKLIILKARQQGISTQTEGLIFHDTVTRENRNSLIMAHDPDSTRNIFEMNKLFYDELDADIRPEKRYDNTTRLVFDNPDSKSREREPGLRSQITIATANKKAVGRGVTLHNFHGSEVAFWNDAADTMLAVNQAIPSHEDIIVVLESTANGVGGYFFDTYWKAVKKENDYVPIFLPWFEFPEYSRPLDSDFILTDSERNIKKLHNLTNEQVNWRRWAIANKCDGDEMKFCQEYPSNDMEAFITSGSPKFDMANLKLYYDNMRPPIFRGNLQSEADSISSPVLAKSENGPLRIYELPNPDHAYVIGGDVAKGTQYSDFSSLTVLDKNTGDVVAVWYGKIDPTEFAYMAARLGYFYKGNRRAAFLGVEVNKDGQTTNRVLYREIRYPNLYRRRNLGVKNEKQEQRIGFHTNDRSRPIIINKLARWITEGEMALNDATTISECMTFVIIDGKPQAQEGCHDDSVISLAIAVFLYEYVPEKSKEKTEAENRIKMLQSKRMNPKW